MDNLVEQLYLGTLDFSRVNLGLKHFIDRTIQRNIPENHIQHLIKNVPMLHYKKSFGHGDEAYKLFYPPGTLPNYGKIVLGVEIFDNKINVKTVYEDKLTSSGTRRHSSKSINELDDFELQEKLISNARYKW